jgi:hypothetical protein
LDSKAVFEEFLDDLRGRTAADYGEKLVSLRSLARSYLKKVDDRLEVLDVLHRKAAWSDGARGSGDRRAGAEGHLAPWRRGAAEAARRRRDPDRTRRLAQREA